MNPNTPCMGSRSTLLGSWKWFLSQCKIEECSFLNIIVDLKMQSNRQWTVMTFKPKWTILNSITFQYHRPDGKVSLWTDDNWGLYHNRSSWFSVIRHGIRHYCQWIYIYIILFFFFTFITFISLQYFISYQMYCKYL